MVSVEGRGPQKPFLARSFEEAAVGCDQIEGAPVAEAKLRRLAAGRSCEPEAHEEDSKPSHAHMADLSCNVPA
jgi:hypothetical protein